MKERSQQLRRLASLVDRPIEFQLQVQQVVWNVISQVAALRMVPHMFDRVQGRAVEVFSNLMDGGVVMRRCPRFLPDTIHELHSADQLRQQRATVQSSPVRLGRLGQLEDRRQARRAAGRRREGPPSERPWRPVAACLRLSYLVTCGVSFPLGTRCPDHARHQGYTGFFHAPNPQDSTIPRCRVSEDLRLSTAAVRD